MRFYMSLGLSFCILSALAMTPVLDAQVGPQAAPQAVGVHGTMPRALPGAKTTFAECHDVAPGRVTMNFLVGTDGVPSDVQIKQSPGPAQTACATAMILAQRFAPAMVDGQAVAVRIDGAMEVKSNQ